MKDWNRILGITGSNTIAIRMKYKRLRKINHPKKCSGDRTKFDQLGVAYEQARKELNF